jgi:hypothetical protein
MGVELAFVCASSAGIIPIDLHIFRNRIVQFFAHMYYWLPVIHFASREIFPLSPPLAVEGKWVGRKRRCRKALHAFFVGYSRYFLVFFLALMCFYNFLSWLKLYGMGSGA